MVSKLIFTPHAAAALSPSKQRDMLQRLVASASTVVNAQLDAFAARMAADLLAGSSTAVDAKQANLGFNAGNLLKKNAYPFYHLASAGIRSALQDAADALDVLVQQAEEVDPDSLALVPFDEIERRLLLDRLSRPLELAHADLYAALNLRLAALLDRDQIGSAENPFRPAVLLGALDVIWHEFDPDEESHSLMLQQLESGIFFDLDAILKAVNQVCIDAGVLANLSESYHIRKSAGNRNPPREPVPDPALMQQLRRLLTAPPTASYPNPPPEASQNARQSDPIPVPGFPPIQLFDAPAGVGAFSPSLAVSAPASAIAPDAASASAGASAAGATANTSTASSFTAPAIAPALSAYLDDLQRRASQAQADCGSGPSCASGTRPNAARHEGAQRSAYRLSDMQAQLPRETLSRADETTVDVMTRIFDAVFRDPHIPPEMKELIGYLQIPVLKAALVDKEFFFEEMHPARRLISLLTRSSVGWDNSKGRDDPLYRAIARNVDRVQDFDTELGLFDEVADDLETFLRQEDTQAGARLAAPITQALQQEKLREASRSASSDVAVRVATGEVATFVEAFLESRWVPVLTLAHSVKDEKPQVLRSAIKTMDDLIWSVQPKISAQQRKELVAKLPTLLSTLNKWLNLLKWDDADRLQFFADLAECHASIVRAPLELSPQRQVELAVEAAQRATERRLEKRAALPAEPAPDACAIEVETFERGMWFAFRQPDGSQRRLKLAWVSPLKSLYIFTTVQREEAFSMAADVLAQTLREQRVELLQADGFVNRALVEILGQASETASSAEMTASA